MLTSHRSRTRLLAAAGLLLAAASPAWALDYRSTARPALLYDAPSTAANKVAAAGGDVPFEVVIDTENWVKVRDYTGRLAWIEKAALGGPHSVIVKAESATVRKQPRANADAVFRAARGVLLVVTAPPDASGWLPVKHADGLAGWIAAGDVWGR